MSAENARQAAIEAGRLTLTESLLGDGTADEIAARVLDAAHEAGLILWADEFEQVGWQWIDDGIADGGLMPLDWEHRPNGDSRYKPVFRRVGHSQ